MSALDKMPEIAAEPRAAAPGPAPVPAAGPARLEPLNLARRPFLNSRPVVRISLLLWLAGLLILIANLSLFHIYLSGSADKRAQIARGEREIERQQQAVQQLQGRLDSIDLGRQNEEIDFLNRKIAQRTFAWSLLLDRLVEVLPNDVHLSRLAPETETKEGASRSARRASRSRRDEDAVSLRITGETRNDEALLRFVDNLFAHPAFTDPNLLREERQDNNLVRFELTVQYIPGKPQGGAVAEPPAARQAPGSAPAAPAAPRVAASLGDRP
jgi:Tfp pilus assembly protein PilN